MAATQQNPQDKKQEQPAEPETDKKQGPELATVTLLKNVKYGDTPHKIGEKLTIPTDDLPAFQRAGAVKAE